MSELAISKTTVTPFLAPKMDELISICGGGDMERGRTTITKEMSFAIQAANANYALAKASPQSVAQAVYNTIVCGLSLNPHLQLAALVPFAGDAKMMPQYQGLVKLAGETGAFSGAPFTGVVYKGDEFTEIRGTKQELIHVPKYETTKNEDITHFYAIYPLSVGSSTFEVMSKAQVDNIMQRAQAYKSAIKNNKFDTPWFTDYPEMGRKTVLKRGLKSVPKTAGDPAKFERLAQAMAVDNDASPLDAAPLKALPQASVEKILANIKTEDNLTDLKESLAQEDSIPQNQKDEIINAATEKVAQNLFGDPA